MEKVNHLENRKLTLNILMISGVILTIIIFLFEPDCIVSKIFNLPCPTCGLTRGIIAIIHLDFLSAFNYNILSIPMFFSIILLCILFLIYLVFKKEYIYNFIEFFLHNYIFIIILLILSWGVNIVKYMS